MFDTRDQILNQLRAGEDGRAEFEDVRLGERGLVAPMRKNLRASWWRSRIPRAASSSSASTTPAPCARLRSSAWIWWTVGPSTLTNEPARADSTDLRSQQVPVPPSWANHDVTPGFWVCGNGGADPKGCGQNDHVSACPPMSWFMPSASLGRCPTRSTARSPSLPSSCSPRSTPARSAAPMNRTSWTPSTRPSSTPSPTGTTPNPARRFACSCLPTGSIWIDAPTPS